MIFNSSFITSSNKNKCINARFDGFLGGLRISLQGQNLTDEDEETVDDNGIVQTRRSFGPTYLLNFNYSFFNN